MRGPDMTEYQAIVEGRAVANGTSYVDVHNTVEDALAEGADMVWSTEVDDDTDPIELVIDIESYAALVAKAKLADKHTRHMLECDGCLPD